jgi:hypothetical protein
MGVVKWNAYLKVRHVCQHDRICQRKDLVAFRQVHRAEHFVKPESSRNPQRSAFRMVLWAEHFGNANHACFNSNNSELPSQEAALDSGVVLAELRTHAAFRKCDDYTWLHELYNSVSEWEL